MLEAFLNQEVSMGGKSDLRRLLDAIGSEFGHDTLKDIADAAGTPRRAQMSGTKEGICKRYDYDVEAFFESRAARVLSRDSWNDLAESFGLPRRKSMDDIFESLFNEL